MPKETKDTNAPQAGATPNTPAKASGNGYDVLRQRIIGRVESDIADLVNQGRLQIPPGYSVKNAMTFAWLMLQEVKDKDGRTALDVVARSSVASALLRMVVQGLDPAKLQCYFIVYGKSLSCQRSYFGDMAILRRARPGAEVTAGVVYEGDTFRYQMVPRRIVSHEQDLANVDPDRMVAAYAFVTVNGEQIGAEVMTMDRIKRSWSKSKTFGNDRFKDKTHDQFGDEMAMRTVIRRAVKYLINQSGDPWLKDTDPTDDMDAAETTLAGDVAEFANGDVIDVDPLDREDDDLAEAYGDDEPAALESDAGNAPAPSAPAASGQPALVPDEDDADF